MDQNLLTLNESKTYFVPFSKSNNNNIDIQPDIKIHTYQCFNKDTICNCTKTINSASNIKYLGVYIDQNLKYDIHVQYITKKIRKTIYKFYQLREFMTKILLKTIYQALVESSINYGLKIWGSTCGNILQNLTLTQKYILKIINKKPKRYSSESLFTESGALSIRELYVKSTLNYMKYKNTYKNYIQHNINTRSITQDHVYTNRVEFLACQRHVSFTGPRLFNMLPSHIKNINIINRKMFNVKASHWIKENSETIITKLPFLK